MNAIIDLAMAMGFGWWFDTDHCELWLYNNDKKPAFSITYADLDDHYIVHSWWYSKDKQDWMWLEVTRDMLKLEMEKYCSNM